MIRWTKDGKVDRAAAKATFDTWNELADALDMAVAALRKIRGDKPTKRDEKDEEIADDALHQIGVDQ